MNKIAYRMGCVNICIVLVFNVTQSCVCICSIIKIAKLTLFLALQKTLQFYCNLPKMLLRYFLKHIFIGEMFYWL